MKALDSPQLFEYLYGRRGVANGGGSNASQHRTALQNMLTYAANRGLCFHIAVPKMTGSGAGQTLERPDWARLSADQILAVQEAMLCPRSRLLVAISANTAMRIDDILNIRLRNVRLATNDLKVRIQKSRIWDNKPVTFELDQELRRYMTWYAQRCGVSERDDVFLVPGYKRVSWGQGERGWEPNPEQPLSYQWSYRRLLKAFDSAGIQYEEKEAWHMIRRSVARLYFDSCVEDGYDFALRMTQALLNHKDVSTTEKYLGLKIETVKRDASLKRKRFLTSGRDNVVSLPTRMC
ncbi:tyrosine-type recombinase/integrase [Streptomyces sp. NPDC055085]